MHKQFGRGLAHRLIAGYGLSLGAFVVAAVGRWLLTPVLSDDLPYFTFYFAVIVAAWYGGLGPGLLTLALGLGVGTFLFTTSPFDLRANNLAVPFDAFRFLTVGGAVSGICELLHRNCLDSDLRAELLRVTMSSMGDAVVMTDAEGRVTFLNGVAESLTGWTTDDAKGLPLETVFHIVNESTRQAVENPAMRALREGVVVGLANHTVLIAKDGTERPIDDSAAPIRDDRGQMTGCVLIFRDVSERRQTERQLESQLAAARLLASIVDNSEDAIVSKSLEGTIRTWNAAAERLFGYTAAEAVGRSVTMLIPPERLDEEGRIIARIQAGETVERLDTVRLRRDGQVIDVSLTISPVKDESGRIIGASKIARDITERRRLETERERYQRTLSTLIGRCPFGIYLVDADFRMAGINAGSKMKTFVNVRPLIKRPLDEVMRVLWPEPLATELIAIFRRTLATGEPYRSTDFVSRRADTDETEGYEWELHRIRLPDGRHGVVCYYFDSTRLRRVERQLRESERRYRLVGDAANDAIWDWDLVADTIVWNEGVRRAFGYEPDRIGPTSSWWIEHIHPDDRDQVVRGVQSVMNGAGDAWASEYRFRRADGTYAAVLDRGKVVREGGLPVRMVGSMLDLTEKQQAAAALRERTSQLNLTLEATGVGMWLNTMPLGNLNWDKRTRELFHVPPDEEPTLELFMSRLHPDDRELTRRATEAAVRDRSLYDIEHRVVHPTTGAIRWVRSMGQATYDDAGVPTRFDGINFDVTERKHMEEELRRIAAELSEASRKKDEFLATLAHELRNPLAPIRSGLEIMKVAGDDVETVEQARSIMERQVEQMVRLIDDLMDVSRITQGKIVLHRTRMPLADAVRNAVDASQPLIESSGHALTLDLPDEPIHVDGDLARLSQVFANLLNNAAKYTERGGRIRLAVERHGAEAVVSVEDNGVGIPAAMLERVFDLFAQVDRSIEKSQGGLGIGLNLVRRLVEMHGGTIAVESDGPDQGSRFTVRLPVATSDTTRVTKPSGNGEARPASRRILIVDDNRDAANTLATILRMRGNETRTAHDGLEAVAVAEAFQPDVVLMDIGMPKLNGYDACRRIREQPWGRNMVLVAQTGWGQDDDKRRATDAGFDHHMTKPIDPATLETTLGELSSESVDPRSQPARTGSRPA